MKRAMLLIGVLLIAGCGEPTFDASSDAAERASVERMTRDLSPTDKQRFLRGVLGDAMKSAARARRAGKTQSASESAKSLHGLTAQQIMAKGDAMGAK